MGAKKQEENLMGNKEGWIVGGSLMIGVGVGFFLFHLSIFFFIGAIICGLGVGLVLETIFGKKPQG